MRKQDTNVHARCKRPSIFPKATPKNKGEGKQRKDHFAKTHCQSAAYAKQQPATPKQMHQQKQTGNKDTLALNSAEIMSQRHTDNMPISTLQKAKPSLPQATPKNNENGKIVSPKHTASRLLTRSNSQQRVKKCSNKSKLETLETTTRLR